LHAEGRASDLAFGDQLVADPSGEVDRDRKTEADASAPGVRQRGAGSVDPDETGVAVDEGAAAVARIGPLRARPVGDGRG
jgi:hypothetical protein